MSQHAFYTFQTWAYLFNAGVFVFALWVWHRSLKVILSMLTSIFALLQVLTNPIGAMPISLPTHCFSCGVYLQGGATKHKDGCFIKSLIKEHFPAVN